MSGFDSFDDSLNVKENKRLKFLINRIDRLDACIHQLEVTSNNYYSSEEELKYWNILLSSRDKLIKMRDKDWLEYDKLKKNKH